MTGEPFPAEKRAGPSDAKLPSDAFNALFAGTSVVSGEATMLVVATGREDTLRQHRSGACVERSAERSRSAAFTSRPVDPPPHELFGAFRSARAFRASAARCWTPSCSPSRSRSD